MTDQHPQDPEGTEAPAIPEAMRPATADMWGSSTDQEQPPAASEAKVTNEPEFSTQSMVAIRAIEEGLKEPSCTQIDSYGPGRISAQVDGVHRLLKGIAFTSNDEYLRWLKKIVDSADDVTTWNKIKSERMGVLNIGGGRFTIMLPPIARPFTTFSMRKHTASKWGTDAFLDRGTLDRRILDFLVACVRAKVNILFVGQMGSGKTTLLRALAQSHIGANEKVAVVEQVPELSLKHDFVVEYIYQPTVEGLTLTDVLDYQLYNGLDRLIVGETHLVGLTKMLETMIITEGSMSTYHAFSTEQAGERMKLALQIENPNATAETAISFIKQAVELVVVLEKVEGVRRVTQVTEIDWRSSAGKEFLAGRNMFVYDREKQRFRAEHEPDHGGRIWQKAHDKYQIDMPREWFIDVEELARFKHGRPNQ